MDPKALFTLDNEEDLLIQESSPHFLLYQKINRHDVDCYCTACRRRFDTPIKGHSCASFKHNEYGLCPSCGAEVRFLSMGRGRSTKCIPHNFALFVNDGYNRLIIKCVRVEITWPESDNYEPDYYTYVITSYVLEPNSAIQYLHKYNYNTGKSIWLPAKAPHEPVFKQTMGYSEKWYTLLNDEVAVMSSFLKYCCLAIPSIDSSYISYLCKCAKHPNMEYLSKGGFWNVAWDITLGHGPKYINWKSNDLKKMLRLSAQEIKYFSEDGNDMRYQSYIDFRRYAFGGKIDKQGNQSLRYFKHFGRNGKEKLEQIMRIIQSRARMTQVMDYLIKQSAKYGQVAVHFLISYCDYLKACEKLRYSLDDPAVLFPKELNGAHDRATEAERIITMQNTTRILNKSNHRFDKIRSLLYFDYGDLEIIIPSDVCEIIEEGRKQSHCVASYVERHADGKLTIAFLRFKSAPDISYYTLEISDTLKINQYRGYKNNIERNGGKPVSDEVEEFITEYKKHLSEILPKWKKMQDKLKKSEKEKKVA